jgi:threonine/homoserine/homoserine lactone efflux protein
MDYLQQGMKVGLVLSLLAGPIFFALVQTGIEKGLRAGTMVGLGIWISDALFILGVYYGLSYVKNFVSGRIFVLSLGIAGGVLLMIFGLTALLMRPRQQLPPRSFVAGASTWLALWLKGFLINTVNPFTFFFWIGIAGVVVVDGELAPRQSFSYFAGIMSIVVATDFLKVALAKRIRHFLRPAHLLWMRRISGAGLILFGIALIVRVVAG